MALRRPAAICALAVLVLVAACRSQCAAAGAAVAGGCSVEVGARCKAASGHALLQVSAHASLERSVSESRQDRAGSNRTALAFASPEVLAEAVRLALGAVNAALPHFSQQVPFVQRGLEVFGKELVGAVQAVLPPHLASSELLAEFRQAVWDTLGNLLEEGEVHSLIGTYAGEGSAEALLEALTHMLDAMAVGVATRTGPGVGREVASFLSSVSDVITGAGEGVALVEEGDQVQGVSAVLGGFRSAVGGMLPGGLLGSGGPAEDSAVEQVVLHAEGALGGVLTRVFNFVRFVVDHTVCWRRSAERARQRPTNCEAGTALSGRWCLPAAEGEQMQPKVRAHRPLCQTGASARGGWCYVDCAPGYEPANRHCKQSCSGKYYVSSPLMCGNGPNTVSMAITEILAKTAYAAVTKEGLRKLVDDAGLVLAGQLTTVMQAIADFARPFGHPSCPDLFGGMSHASMR